MKKDMIENVATSLSSGDGDLEVFFNGVLADVLVKAARPQAHVKTEILIEFCSSQHGCHAQARRLFAITDLKAASFLLVRLPVNACPV